MARTFRLYGKKLGHRRSGSDALGRWGLALFFALAYGVGCGLLATTVNNRLLPEWRVVTYYRPLDVTVLRSRVGELHERGAKVYRPEVHVQFEAAGQHRAVWSFVDASGTCSPDRDITQRVVARYPAGRSLRGWYDPVQPDRVILERGFRWLTALELILPMAFLGIGGGGLAYLYLRAGRSREEQAVLAQQRLSPAEALGMEPREWPWPSVPTYQHLVNSPGTKLAWRLPVSVSSKWPLTTLLVSSAVVNLLVLLFVALALRGYLRGQPEWQFIGFAAAWAVAGIGLGFLSLKRLLRATAWGPTIVEISEVPLRPGQRYSVFVSQSARAKLRQFRLWLVCEEQAIFRQGTDTRVATQVVYRQQLFTAENIEGDKKSGFTGAAELLVPHRAMHSFVAEQNSVQWRLVAEGEVEGRPRLDRVFPLVVVPKVDAETPV